MRRNNLNLCNGLSYQLDTSRLLAHDYMAAQQIISYNASNN